MAYRDDAGEVIEAPTAEGLLRVELGPRHTKLAVGNRVLDVVGRVATLTDPRKPGKRQSIEIKHRLIVARDVPQDDLGIWMGDDTGMRRIWGVVATNALEPSGLAQLAVFDRVAGRVRMALAELAGDVVRAIEIGGPLGKLLFAEHADRHVVYSRALFKNGARPALSVFPDGRIIVHDGTTAPPTVTVTSRFGITVGGDYIRFAGPDGTDLARVSLPWLTPEDRRELARRIGLLVDVAQNL